MNWMKLLKATALLSMLTLAACNAEVGNVSPQDIIENVVQENEEPIAYYGESTMTLSDGTSFTMKEWKAKDGKVRTEMVDSLGNVSHSVNDGVHVWMHDVATNEVMQFTLDEETAQGVNKSPSEQAKAMLETIENTHAIEVVGNETLLDRAVIHVKATPKNNEENLFGEQELWIDKDTWFVLKSVSKIDGKQTKTAYKTFDVSPKLDSELFVFTMPDGAEMVELGEVEEPLVVHSIEEAIPYIDKPFYYVEDQQDITLHDISVFSMEGVPGSLTLNYIKQDMPYFSLVVMPVEEPNVPYNGTEGIDVRDQQASLVEAGNFRSISWVENGIGYALLIESADVTTEEVVDLFNAIQ